MELIFIRHGQGEHTMDMPKSLQHCDPALTSLGRDQARLLKDQFLLNEKDIIIISPTRRTLETALIFCGNSNCRMVVSPLVSPRMFPIHPHKKTLPCDRILELDRIKNEYPDLEYDDKGNSMELWEIGINTMDERTFEILARGFLSKCKTVDNGRVFIVSHDGTITSYHQLITGGILSREDFPKETEWIQFRY
ncbi:MULTISPECIES: histidine phosphatase family protein [Bhargavaea]|uniref:Histidine phosphatase family protein n=1 Tax=Bhargavaea changchunensis TaxID=2134037 RepID=A0ABW2NMD3_9BACL|nr:histidine phosphatase family protein [Bhargavaea sp. CC-171006]